ncbi:MAG TPA: OsmC family peroxiredoxin, partial [Longilinea sp.]|nr:OsmC family peroxiredoxin [Longilinea sp.]
LNQIPFSSTTRFQNVDSKMGTNPEELIAAAHAGCFSMALSFQLSGAGFVPTELKTTATILLRQKESGFEIAEIQLNLEGKVPGVTEEKFQELAQVAKKNCPVSKALAAVPISLTARLVQ